MFTSALIIVQIHFSFQKLSIFKKNKYLNISELGVGCNFTLFENSLWKSIHVMSQKSVKRYMLDN